MTLRRRPKPLGKRKIHTSAIALARRRLHPTLPKPKKPRITFIRTSKPKPKKSKPPSPQTTLRKAANFAVRGIGRHFGLKLK